MLVIHPSDQITDFLRPLYEGQEDVRLLTGRESKKELGSILSSGFGATLTCLPARNISTACFPG